MFADIGSRKGKPYRQVLNHGHSPIIGASMCDRGRAAVFDSDGGNVAGHFAQLLPPSLTDVIACEYVTSVTAHQRPLFDKIWDRSVLSFTAL